MLFLNLVKTSVRGIESEVDIACSIMKEVDFVLSSE